MTDEDGCHFGISFTRRGQLQYIHSSCTVQSWIERVGEHGSAKALVSVVGNLAEATTSAEGGKVLFVSDEPDSFAVQESVGGKPARVLFALDRGMKRVRAAYGRTDREIFYQQGGHVWVYDLGRGLRTMIASIEEGSAR